MYLVLGLFISFPYIWNFGILVELIFTYITAGSDPVIISLFSMNRGACVSKKTNSTSASSPISLASMRETSSTRRPAPLNLSSILSNLNDTDLYGFWESGRQVRRQRYRRLYLNNPFNNLSPRSPVSVLDLSQSLSFSPWFPSFSYVCRWSEPSCACYDMWQSSITFSCYINGKFASSFATVIFMRSRRTENPKWFHVLDLQLVIGLTPSDIGLRLKRRQRNPLPCIHI